MRRIVKRKNNGKIKNATSLELPDGTKFRSKLEYFTYNKLKEAGIDDFSYEKDKFVLLDGFEYNSHSIEAYEAKIPGTDIKKKVFEPITNNIRPITYLPDFTCINKDKTGWIIEVKGFSNDAFPLKWKMFKKHLIDNGYKVTLYKPNNQGNVLKCIEMIKEEYYENRKN